MKTDTVIQTEGTQILMDHLGLVDAERFIMLIKRDSFDYTEWQKDLFEGMSVEELNRRAVEYQKSVQLAEHTEQSIAAEPEFEYKYKPKK